MFEGYGGFAAVSKVVMTFQDHLLDGDDVGVYFEDIDLPRLLDHQTNFIAAGMGGPAAFTDEHLRRVHAKHRITSADFDRTAQILAGVLQEGGMEPADIDVLVEEVQRCAPFIVTEQA